MLARILMFKNTIVITSLIFYVCTTVFMIYRLENKLNIATHENERLSYEKKSLEDTIDKLTKEYSKTITVLNENVSSKEKLSKDINRLRASNKDSNEVDVNLVNTSNDIINRLYSKDSNKSREGKNTRSITTNP